MADTAENTSGTEVETPDVNAAKPEAVPPEVKRALSKANKEAETLRLRLKEFEDRDKSELERAAERIEAAEKRATDLEARALRLEVASEQGLTAAQAKRLVGQNREELEADAKELLETFKPAPTEEPREDVATSLDLGNRGGQPRKGKSSGDLFAAAIEGSFTR
jgi:hypothetical protein